MAKTKVTEQLVFALCDRIYIETGKDPRYEDLTPELGCSNVTLKPFLDSWLGRSRPARRPIPEKLAGTLASFAQAMWGHALGAAVEAVLRDRDEQEAALTRCREQLAAALQLIEDGEQERAKSDAEKRALMQEVAELQVKLRMTESVTARCTALEKSLEDMCQKYDDANARAIDALAQAAAHKSHIDVLVKSMRAEPAARGQARQRRPAQNGNAGGSHS